MNCMFDNFATKGYFASNIAVLIVRVQFISSQRISEQFADHHFCEPNIIVFSSIGHHKTLQWKSLQQIF